MPYNEEVSQMSETLNKHKRPALDVALRMGVTDSFVSPEQNVVVAKALSDYLNCAINNRRFIHGYRLDKWRIWRTE